jgi:hypothetical protein
LKLSKIWRTTRRAPSSTGIVASGPPIAVDTHLYHLYINIPVIYQQLKASYTHTQVV